MGRSAGSPEHRFTETLIDPRAVSDWNARCLTRPDANVFQSAEWARVLLETYRWKPFYFEHGNAVLPLIEAESWITGRRGVSLPFSDFSVPVGCDSEQLLGLFNAALETGRSRKWKYIELRNGIDVLPGAVASQRFYSHELDLRPGPDTIFAGFDSSVRRAIRKAEQEGVSVTLSADTEALCAFWRLYNQTRKKHGAPPQPFCFMRNIHQHLLSKGMGFIALARHDAEPIAACMFLDFGKRALYKFGASDMSLQQFRGMNAAFWAGIKHYADRGFSSLSFGRTDVENDGLRRFKLGWGAREMILNYCKYDLARDKFIGLGECRGRHLATSVFRRLPIPVLRLVGKMLYPHIA